MTSVAADGQLARVPLYASGSVPQRVPRRVRETSREGLEMWLRLAETDFRTATMAFEAEPLLAGPACFHRHECVEKLLKTLIVEADRRRRRARIRGRPAYSRPPAPAMNY